MSEMGLPNQVTIDTSTVSTECATPDVKPSPEMLTKRKEHIVNKSTTVAVKEECKSVIPATPKKIKKKKKRKKNSYKSFLKSAMKSSKTEAVKKQEYKEKITDGMGGGSFSKMNKL